MLRLRPVLEHLHELPLRQASDGGPPGTFMGNFGSTNTTASLFCHSATGQIPDFWMLRIF